MKQIYTLIIAILFSGLGLIAQTNELEITSSLDNTIFKDTELSNGKGQHIFTGTSNKDVIRRALVQFDLRDLPAGVTIDSAFLILKPVKVKPASTVVSVYRVNTAWGEGDSEAQDGDGKGAPATAGDATWRYAKFPNILWIKEGGDYELQPSVSDTVKLGSDAVFGSINLALDVNFWLQDTSKNFGWVLVGDEFNLGTSVKFGSRENDDENLWPVLKLYYQGTTSIDEKHPVPEIILSQVANSDALLVMNPLKPGRAMIEIFSMTGVRLWSSRQELIAGDNHISTGHLKTGIYLYRVNLNGISVSGKLLITHR
jgi:hypothetical protein